MAISHFALLIPGNFAADDPFTGLEDTLRLFELAEELGYDSAWVRQRHLERGVSSAATFLAAATQRTERIGLGTAVIQLGYENPFRLAEDLATVDVLSRGRLNVGVSAGPAPFAHLLGDFLPHWPEEGRYTPAEKLARALRSEPLAEAAVAGNAAGQQIPRLHPFAKGLTGRLWYGGGSQASAAWAGQNGWRLLTGNVITAERSTDFLTTQQDLIATYLANWAGEGAPDVALGRVILPTDSASPAARAKYHAFAETRLARTRQPNGPGQTMFLPDLVGTTDEILTALRRDPILPQAGHFRLELPYEFETGDYRQILRDFTRLIPELR
ncbi:LLM class flavin-dependent oxidoreductase [Sinirhodobacter populi]|uniref:LLM class flavin-dependent oxidoreductase n=1 Tax=Paenirhodobacter populi TaxID=2306993 RepID=A0A443KP02_9RHOB|nr:LLM class flavin-dependent oxidoreductase [Sinirhodobacter populi]RWR34625.1 LLM class flavin-dependent oxidoreductase [Sinirhodobacter populi]